MSWKTCLSLGVILLLALSAASGQAQLTPGPTATKELFTELADKDRALFDAMFNKCDPDGIGALITDDFEFYHDKWGLTATSRTEFVEIMRKACARQASGEDFRARRELVDGSLEVYPLNNYGAIQMGVHRFYRKTEGQPDKLTEISKFTNVWKKDKDGWRLARVLSYDHKLAE